MSPKPASSDRWSHFLLIAGMPLVAAAVVIIYGRSLPPPPGCWGFCPDFTIPALMLLGQCAAPIGIGGVLWMLHKARWTEVAMGLIVGIPISIVAVAMVSSH